MDNDLHVARLKGIVLDILSEEDAGKLSAIVIRTANEVTDATLGLPTTNAPECLTCGAKNSKDDSKTSKDCEGHFGLINLPYTILNPHFMSEVAKVLNQICPGCKSVRRKKDKEAHSASKQLQPINCRYCTGTYRDGYPKMKFKVSSKDVFAKTAIIAEIDEKSKNKNHRVLASDYWDIIPKDPEQEGSGLQSNRRVLLPAQVYDILKDVTPRYVEAIFKRKNSILLNSILVTPNSHRVREFRQGITYDETTRIYKRLTDFRGTQNELSARVLDRYKVSKKRSAMQPNYEKQSTNDSVSSVAGLNNIKDLLFGKFNDHSFRMVVVGDPRIKVDEIGLPIQIADSVLISDNIHLWNWNKLEPCCDFMLNKKGQFSVSRDGQNIFIGSKDMLRTGDSIKRPLIDGDIVLINRPPSIHQHSLIALSVKVLPTNSVVSINPLICDPLRGDFDGDCLHGYVPQSVSTRVELKELVSLNKQLVDGQSGQNLLTLSQDSLTAAYLILGDGVLLNKSEMQQLQMLCSCLPVLPAFTQSTFTEASFWTGKQLFSLLLPLDFDFSYATNGVRIRQGELISSSHGSSWLRNSGENLVRCLIRHCGEKALEFLNAAQEVLCEWLSRRGLSVSLSDLCLSSDTHSRENLLEDISCGLQEAEKLSDVSLLMVHQNQQFLVESCEEDDKSNYLNEHLYAARQTSAELCQASLSASKSVFWDMQNLVYKYADNNNSFIAMLKAGSKGNLPKLFQHSMCVGLQHSSTPLSFTIPQCLSCASWNYQKTVSSFYRSDGTRMVSDSYIPCTVVGSSYLVGLNPLECFVHSLTNRDSCFSGQAVVSGSLSKKLMLFMRDLIIGYDGTVRNCYGNQVVQFNYCTEDENMSVTHSVALMSGHPVGSLAACAITEAAYSALDQPVSALEPSPLMALKKVLECGVKKKTGLKSASLYLSRMLGRWVNGYEYGAVEVKHHLESLVFSDVVSKVMISFSKESSTNISPWVCHFHINKEVAKKRRLKPESIIDALHKNCNAVGLKMEVTLPTLLIENRDCPEADDQQKIDTEIWISVTESPKEFASLENLRDVVIPVLLRTVIKGFPEFKKVDILWKDESNCSKSPKRSSGQLFLRVIMSTYCERTKFWSILKEKCLRIRNIIDWECSHPDDIHDYSEAYGIDMAWQHFVNTLHSATSNIGRTILPEHLVVTANCLSVTGQFVPLHANGLAHQRKEANVHSPFMQACASVCSHSQIDISSLYNNSDCLVKAAKEGQIDSLQGNIDSLVWGQTPPIGTGCQFDIIYSGKGHELAKSTDVYSLLSSHVGSVKPNEKIKLPMKFMSNNSLSQMQFLKKHGREYLLSGMISLHSTVDEIHKVSRALSRMLQEYTTDSQLSGQDKSTAMKVLKFHPRWEDKIGSGAVEIKIGHHPEHEESRCFFVVREDGTEEDISYRKCIHNALELINPQKAKAYHSRWLSRKT
ncbi:hypothetical protein ACJIZ3_004028 [Penstemon smallii]|uniref:DNA-directed RNA polymerase subunit n=1 Tax=Penstemon smallii TaxID=265156 RepID=A0ABD3S0W1_9LAMI